MRNLFFIITLLSSVYSFGQCDEYYINELVSGPEDRYFPTGSEIRFCPKLKGVALNGYDFDVSQWQGISTQYLTLTKNGGIAGSLTLSTSERTLKVNLNGSPGVHVYSISLSVDEYNSYVGEYRRKQQEKVQEEINIKKRIEESISNERYFEAFNLLKNSGLSDSVLSRKVYSNWSPIEDKLDYLYKDYLNDFEKFKKESLMKFNENRETFLAENKNILIKTNCSIKGIDYLELKENDYIKSNEKFAYLIKKDDKYLIYPLGYGFNRFFSEKYADKIEIKYGVNSNDLKPAILIYSNGQLIDSLIVVNSLSKDVETIEYDYSEKLKESFLKYETEYYSKYFEQKFPKLKLNLNDSEIIEVNFKLISRPEDETQKNETVDKFTNIFITEKIKSYLPKRPEFCPLYSLNNQKIILNQKLALKLQKIFLDYKYDTIALIYSRIYEEFIQFPKRAIGIPNFNEGNRGGFYFYPLKRGSGVELYNIEDGDFLKFNYTNGNYKEVSIDKIIKYYTPTELNSELKYYENHKKELDKFMKKDAIYYYYSSFFTPPNVNGVKDPIPNDVFISNKVVICTLPVFYYKTGWGENQLSIPYPNDLKYIPD